MSLRTWVPRWWAGEAGAAGAVLSAALLPAEAGFRGVAALRNAAYDRAVLRVERAPVPVVSIGNLAVGGAGKTPVAAWVAGRLLDSGRRPGIALRGYGEDEVLVHRELNPEVPVFAAARRIEAARAAAEAGCDVVVLDDGFQHRALARDLDVVLIAVEGWQARPRVLPRGPWREGPGALGRADVVVLTRKSAPRARAEAVAREVERWTAGKIVVACHLAPGRLAALHGEGHLELSALDGRPVLAVAALADPGPFVEHLRAAGATVEEALFGDHHAFTSTEAAGLADRAGERVVVMTRKDAVKLRGLLPAGARAYVLEQTVRFDWGEEALLAALERMPG
ncbi:MAG TPA: tetraacyldisaccharide 4'-kinase [Longimicrobium sp.]